MENEEKDAVIVDGEEETNNEKEEEKAEVESKKDEKPKRTPEEELDYLEGRAKRLRKKLGKDEPKKEETSKPKNEENVRYDKLAYLESKQVAEEDQDWVMEQAEEMKVSLTEFLKKEWVKNELKEREQLRKTKDATPKSGKRSASGQGDEKESAFQRYMNDGTLPQDRELREYVVERRMKQDTSNKPFYNS
jgi:hypothetical protein